MSQASKPLYLVANWKSHKTLSESLSWFSALLNTPISDALNVIVCPPFPYLPKISDLRSKILLGAQNLSPFPYGAYTGEVSAAMLKDIVKYVIVGHSERRQYFHETHQEIANKIRESQSVGITPILCLDEPYLVEQYEVLEPSMLSQLIIAYEPLSAIGSGTPDTPEHANEVAARIQSVFRSPIPVLYGGSVKPDNIASFLKLPNISGALVGGASLDAQSFSQLISVVSNP